MIVLPALRESICAFRSSLIDPAVIGRYSLMQGTIRSVPSFILMRLWCPSFAFGALAVATGASVTDAIYTT